MNTLLTKVSTLCMLFSVLSVAVAQRTISGTVSSNDGPLPGATVIIDNTNHGTTTDFDGKFSIEASSGDVLVVSFVGYATQELTIGEMSQLSIVLQEDQLLDEVVVTALGLTREKKSLGYTVTEVSGDNVNTIKDHNVANSLTGKVPGLVISQSGTVGAASRVVLRGDNSIQARTTQALIVVDGVPINDDGIESGGGVYNSRVTGGGLTDINPNDIESISVLKGPNAAALYGSRAGNGVILVTTKKGTKGDNLGVTINTNITFDKPMFLPEFQNQYGQGNAGAPNDKLETNFSAGSWGSKLDGTQQLYFTGKDAPYIAYPDNVKDFFETGVKTITSVALNKGSENASTRFSYTHNNSETILPNSDLESHNFNLRGQLQLSSKLSLDAKATYFTQEVTNRQSAGGEGVIGNVFNIPRSVNVSDLKQFQKPNPGPGEYNAITYAGPSNNLVGNPYWMLLHDENNERRNRFFGFAKIDYAFNDWLSAFVRIGADVTNINDININKPGNNFYRSGRMSKGQYSSGELNSEFLITATRDLTENLNMVFSAGGILSKRTYESLINSGADFKIPTKFFLNNLNTLDSPEETPQQIKKVHSLYAFANFAYDDFLYLDLTARNDWSSTLAKDNRSYLYPSVSLSALLNRFVDPDRNLFDLIKVRGSWAQVGNDTDPYQLYQTLEVPGQGFLGLTSLNAPEIKYDPNLKPETVISSEFGLELRMFSNRMNFEFSMYDIRTEDLIYDLPVPAATGYEFFKENLDGGIISNKGFEIALGGTPIKNDNFSWNTSLFFSKNKNKFTWSETTLENIELNRTNSGNLSVVAKVNGSIGDLYGTVWDKDENGNYLVNANGIPMASSGNPKFLGNAAPDWLGGWSNDLSIGDFSVSFHIDARIGGEFYSQTSSLLDANGVSARSLQYRDGGVILEAINTGTNAANTKSITGQEYWGAMSGIAENYIYDQTNIRLREVALGYTIPNTERFGVQRATVQLIGRNLFFLMKKADDVDPETSLGTSLDGQGINSNNLPAIRSLGLNLTLNF